MALLLRKINQSRWLQAQELRGLGEMDVAADPVANFADKCRDNSLSVWEIDDGKTRIGRVAAAIASMGEKVDRFDYILIDTKHLQSAGVEHVPTSGASQDDIANEWHVDLCELTGLQIVRLVRLLVEDIAVDVSKINRISRREMAQHFANAFQNRWIDPASRSTSLQRSLKL